jgi:sugar phosphate isomerase/epimerase
LYSLREQAEKDFVGVLERLAKIGYKGVEPAGFWNLTPKELKKIVNDLGMEISSTHSPWARPDNISEVIDIAGDLGINMVACGYGTDAFNSVEAIKKTADEVNAMIKPLKAAGITLFQHNHYWEFERIDGKIAYDIYAELCPEIKFELDTYWAANFGAEDPAEQVKKFADRAPLLHIKDGPLKRDTAMLAVGSGKIDVPAVIAAANESVLRWLVVELDRCDTDMFTAVEESYKYLVGNGLAAGNK